MLSPGWSFSPSVSSSNNLFCSKCLVLILIVGTVLGNTHVCDYRSWAEGPVAILHDYDSKCLLCNASINVFDGLTSPLRK